MKVDMDALEVLKNSQRVIEYQIQPYHSGKLTEYQVCLTNTGITVPNEVDGIIVDGKLVNFWVETETDKIWIKLPEFKANTPTRAYICLGDPSGPDLSIDGKTCFGAFWDNTDAADFTPSNMQISVSGDYLRFLNPDDGTIGASYAAIDIPDTVYIFEARYKTESVAADDNAGILIADGDLTARFSAQYAPHHTDQAKWGYFNGATTILVGAYSEGTEYIIRQIIDETDSATGTSLYLLDTNRAILSSAVDTSHPVGSPSDADRLYFADNLAGSPCDIYIKWAMIRKYTANEPLVRQTRVMDLADARNAFGLT